MKDINIDMNFMNKNTGRAITTSVFIKDDDIKDFSSRKRELSIRKNIKTAVEAFLTKEILTILTEEGKHEIN